MTNGKHDDRVYRRAEGLAPVGVEEPLGLGGHAEDHRMWGIPILPAPGELVRPSGIGAFYGAETPLSPWFYVSYGL